MFVSMSSSGHVNLEPFSIEESDMEGDNFGFAWMGADGKSDRISCQEMTTGINFYRWEVFKFTSWS